MIPYGRQSIDDDDVAAVVAALRSDWLTTGPRVEEFEAALADAVEAAQAVAFANGTAALHAAAAVAGLGPGDRVVTSPLSFAASATCARYVGATPEFVDIDPATLNMDLSAVPAGVDAVVAVHYAGLPVDLERLPYRPRVVIEDAAHAIGAHTADGPVGNCARSDLCCFSFHPVKTITTGEGGAVTTNSPVLADALRRFRNHGMVKHPEVGGWYYEIEDLAFNYRLTDLQAALGTSQLSKLKRFVDRRNELADRYRAGLAGLPLEAAPVAPAGTRHAYHLFVVQVDDRARVHAALHERGIGAQVHYVPIYRHPLYADLQVDPASFPATERAYERLLSLPLHPGLTPADQDEVISALQDLLGP
ncbi:MAG: UDP-4-amino-4,6-dideoxy-N-acetyl-beta-L-altrosamine transaminase [Acidimicrobiia bacterium]|nr:UDP-4-amino-4,6-dideoxy-N-acetyl-beta-L-altrosamine transaminase [Acidimicrobiia bacterium]